jgi:exosortase
MKIKEYLNQRNLFFFLFLVMAFLMAYAPIKALFNSSIQSDYYSHIVLIPPVSLYLIYQKRRLIFSEQKYCLSAGIPLLLIGALLFFGGRFLEVELNQNDFASIIALSAVVFVNGAFILFYGLHAYKVAIFPLLFLIFVIPIPSALMDGIIHFLQVGSTEFVNVLFMATGVPFLREGFVFHLSGMSIEVAPQCSGIRSGLALFITAILAGHLFLKTGWKKVVLVIFVVPITMFKNGIRIVTLTLLGIYVDPRILGGELHKQGGIPFFIVALLLLAPVLYFLWKTEKTQVQGGSGEEQGERKGV